MTNASSSHLSPETLQSIKRTFVELGREHALEDDITKRRDDDWLWKRAQRVLRCRLRTVDTGTLDILQVQAFAQDGYVEGWCCEHRAIPSVTSVAGRTDRVPSTFTSRLASHGIGGCTCH